MSEKTKKEGKFVDNVAYKNKFQFLIWINDNVICQRYFRINGLNEDAIYSAEFSNCMEGIVDSIQKDLESKSRIYLWYSTVSDSIKSQGFMSEKELEKYGSDFLLLLTNDKIKGEVVAPDGKIFKKEYIEYGPKDKEYTNEINRPSEGEFVFKFAFLIDDKSVYERSWDGNIYPKFVRNGVDLTNNYANYNNKDISNLSFSAVVVRHMQYGKENLITEFIHRICDTLSNSYSEKYIYTKNMTPYKNNNNINKEKYEEAVKYYGVIKPVVTGHTEIKPITRNYNYFSAFEAYKRSWKRASSKKTYKYLIEGYDNMTHAQIEYIDSRY